MCWERPGLPEAGRVAAKFWACAEFGVAAVWCLFMDSKCSYIFAPSGLSIRSDFR